jgi:hypothetical protein
MRTKRERGRRRGGGQEGGGTTGQPQSPSCRRQRQRPTSCPSTRSSQSPLAPCHVSRPEFGLCALLAVSLSVGSVGDRDRAPTGPLHRRVHTGCSDGGGGGPADAPEQSGVGTVAEGRRRDVSIASPLRSRSEPTISTRRMYSSRSSALLAATAAAAVAAAARGFLLIPSYTNTTTTVSSYFLTC